MKKLLLLIVIGLVFLMSGCMAEMEPEVETVEIYDSISYRSSGMSYTNTLESDILYLAQDTYFDFALLYDEVMDVSLSVNEQVAYEQLLGVIDELNENTRLSYPEILNLSSGNFNIQCKDNSIPITLEDIVSFNSFKSLFEEVKTTYNTSPSSISKISYIEMRLDISLTNEEINALDKLQTLYFELYQHTHHPFDFGNRDLTELIILFESDIPYVPSESEIIQLEIAYDIIKELINE